MLKELFVKIRNVIYLWKNKPARSSVKYDDALKVGILINLPDQKHLKIVDAFVNELKKDGKEVTVICNTRNNNCLFTFPFIKLGTEDISWNGNFLSEKINNFIKTNFDYLYCVNISPFLPFENIILKSRAKFKIGFHFPKRQKMFDLMVQLQEGESIDVLVPMMSFFTKKLKSNEQQI